MITHNFNVIIARHGETDSNRDRIVQVPDNALNLNGIKNANDLAGLLADHGILQIVSSNLYRSMQTANIISEILKIPVIDQSPIFQERNFGILRGMSHTEITTQFPHCTDSNKKRMATKVDFPDGESFVEVLDRAKTAIEYINQLQKPTLIISHGAFMRILISSLDNSDPEDLSFTNGDYVKIN